MLGGIGNVPGAMIGGLLLGLIESLGAGYIGELTGGVFGSNYQDVFAFLILVGVLIFRPSGLLANEWPIAPNRSVINIFPQLRNNAGAAWIAMIIVAAVLLALPYFAGGFGNAWVRALAFMLLYIMLALGLNIVVGFAGLLDLGFIAFYAVGAYTYALLASPQLTQNFDGLRRHFRTACTFRSGSSFR